MATVLRVQQHRPASICGVPDGLRTPRSTPACFEVRAEIDIGLGVSKFNTRGGYNA